MRRLYVFAFMSMNGIELLKVETTDLREELFLFLSKQIGKLSRDLSRNGIGPESVSRLNIWGGVAGACCGLLQMKESSFNCPEFQEACFESLVLLRKSFSDNLYADNIGLLSGGIGVLLAAHEVSTVVFPNSDIDWIDGASRAIFQRLLERGSDHNDFVNGVAGALSGVIWLQRRLDLSEPRVVEALILALISRLELTESAFALRSDSNEDGRPVHGLAHGSSGAAVALLEAATFFSSESIQRLAIASLANDELGQRPQSLWPDQRENLPPEMFFKGEGTPFDSLEGLPSTGYMWCHGSSGIGLTHRLFASRLKTRRFANHASLIAADTEQFLLRTNRLNSNLCVCHGLGSLLGLIYRDGNLGASSDFEQMLLPHIRHSLLTFRACLDGHMLKQRAALPVPPTLVGNDELVASSYFLGLSGIAAVLSKVLRSEPQNHLLMPFRI
jgi:hypothetical protein